ncbi:conserved hypothetical protein [Nitrosococcus watsonii C-113]|uniref:Transmembrane protein (PGPGW) n=1 Tax=Nitrosococcus watsoni (strain C-113) TaxID=105559 RepID=D8K6L2_NITWC|nr:conserved hypothetical protein [Nitrosococcus watsonii C-113]
MKNYRNMLHKAKINILQIYRGKRGERFAQHYKFQQRRKSKKKSWETPFYIIMGLLLVVAGILISIPPIGVPGFILTLLGLSLLVSRLRIVAVLLDKGEVTFHHAIKYCKGKLNHYLRK